MTLGRRPEYTFRHNQGLGRHGWLRLTPAYSVRLVGQLMDAVPAGSLVLDPFSGTGTTGIVASQRGLACQCLDINPFLVWLSSAKCRNYREEDLSELHGGAERALGRLDALARREHWLPDIHNITRWWRPQTLRVLGALRSALVAEFGEPANAGAKAPAWVAFCRLVIETSSAAFNHVSMSFRESAATFGPGQIAALYGEILCRIADSAKEPLPARVDIRLADSRGRLPAGGARYSHVVTSPPYPNRLSYIRELRPYMYWTGFLRTARGAGELDWQAVGGTWGVATSRLKEWGREADACAGGLGGLADEIRHTGGKNADLMANYVLKYFHDVRSHLRNLRGHLAPGASLSYILGNSSFYGVQVPTEKILEDCLRGLGFADVESRAIRKRNSKKELFEYCIRGTWPGGAPASRRPARAEPAQAEMF